MFRVTNRHPEDETVVDEHDHEGNKKRGRRHERDVLFRFDETFSLHKNHRFVLPLHQAQACADQGKHPRDADHQIDVSRAHAAFVLQRIYNGDESIDGDGRKTQDGSRAAQHVDPNPKVTPGVAQCCRPLRVVDHLQQLERVRKHANQPISNGKGDYEIIGSPSKSLVVTDTVDDQRVTDDSGDHHCGNED